MHGQAALTKENIMTESYKKLATDLGSKLKEFRTELPETMAGFNQMSKATHADGALSA